MHIPNLFINEFNKFENWHLSIQATLKAKEVKSEDGLEFLKSSFDEWKDQYMKTIEKLGNICFQYDTATQNNIKEYIKKSKVIKFHLEAPYYKQIIEKPRGYAGDSDMMEIIYRNDFEGSSLMGKLIHKIATECEACLAVRNRRALLTKLISEKQGNILSLAAGPSTEVFDVIRLKNSKKYSFFALDHDIQTLKDVKLIDKENLIKYGIINAFHLLKGRRTVLYPRKFMINYCNPINDSKGINKVILPLKYNIHTLKENNFDFVYSAGLYDYIQTFSDPNKGTVALTSKLFKLLKPNGSLIIGNFSLNNPIGIRWVMEFICDWSLIYRSEEDIMNFAKMIPKKDVKNIEILKESTGINYFLRVTKN